MDDAEAQMRRALGLHGDSPRPRLEIDRSESGSRSGGGGFMQGVHRRRFVQDGEVPVTVVRRDPPDPAGSATAGPTSSRLQRVEAALAAETAARDRAERALHEAQSAIQTLQTKIGHHELAKNEALAAGKRDREDAVSLRDELSAAAERLRELETQANDADAELRAARAELTEERHARKAAERRLDEALAQAVPARPAREPVSRVDLPRVPARRGRPPLVRAEPAAEAEPEPVKWWLMPTKPATKRR